ncbi:MAG: glycosyltransferase family 39 protein [Planctomycetes bacterium]|nr:glycosyltransferase family 39 protein [Planctomycetota bacterium]
MKRLVAAWLGLALLLFSLASPNIDNTDATVTMHAARALWLRGDSGLRTREQGGEWPGEWFTAAFIRLKASQGVRYYGKVGANDLVYVWFPMGHLWLMVPAVAVGEALDAAFPGVEARFRERVGPGSLSYRDGHRLFAQAVTALLPALFGATSILLLFFVARALGALPRDALVSTAAIACATQFFPLTRENLSDGPGLCFLLGALLATVRAWSGSASRMCLLAGGAAAGCAVLTRYAHGTLVPFLGLAIAIAALRRRRFTDVLWFLLGGLPCLGVLLLVNWLRYGDVTETGYPKADSWFNYPVWFGVTKILIGAGKGILWFTPLLWLAVPLAIARRHSVRLGWLGWLAFTLSLLMFGATNGWQAGQCWGIRYVTPGIVLLLAIALPQLCPWRSHPRTFAALLLVGLLVNLTGAIAPTRGENQLAGQAVQAMYQREYDAGTISQEDWDNLDAADHFSFLPRFSPLHANWTYAARSLGGDFEDEQGRPRNGSNNTIEPLFGITAVTPGQGLAPGYWEDRCGRHVWWVFWGDLLGVSPYLLVLPVVAAGALLLAAGLRRPILRQP